MLDIADYQKRYEQYLFQWRRMAHRVMSGGSVSYQEARENRDWVLEQRSEYLTLQKMVETDLERTLAQSDQSALQTYVEQRASMHTFDDPAQPYRQLLSHIDSLLVSVDDVLKLFDRVITQHEK